MVAWSTRQHQQALFVDRAGCVRGVAVSRWQAAPLLAPLLLAAPSAVGAGRFSSRLECAPAAPILPRCEKFSPAPRRT